MANMYCCRVEYHQMDRNGMLGVCVKERIYVRMCFFWCVCVFIFLCLCVCVFSCIVSVCAGLSLAGMRSGTIAFSVFSLSESFFITLSCS